jgi:hypothetical protein
LRAKYAESIEKMEVSMRSDISILEVATPETRCLKCGKRVRKGHPRFVIEFKEFGFGPGHPAFSPEALDRDRIQNEACGGQPREFGFLSSTAFSFCDKCAGEDPTIQNLWHAEREERAADDPGGSVWAKPVSWLNIAEAEIEEIREDHGFMSGGNEKGKEKKAPGTGAASNEAQDRILSGHLNKSELRTKPNGRSLFSENDRRHRMARFLLTAESAKMKAAMRKACQLWSDGMKQPEIAKLSGTSQATVCRLIQAADVMAADYSRQTKIK